MARNQHLKTENRIMVCREYAQLWQQFFQFFADELEDVQINEQMEKEFQQVMNILALNYYKFQQLSGEYMKDSETILKILSDAVSMSHLKATPEATLAKLRIDWHTTFIEMNKALGKLLALLPPKKLAEMQQRENEGQT